MPMADAEGGRDGSAGVGPQRSGPLDVSKLIRYGRKSEHSRGVSLEAATWKHEFCRIDLTPGRGIRDSGEGIP